MSSKQFNNISYKTGVNPDDLRALHPGVLLLLGEVALYADSYALPCTITSILDDVPGRKSNTHREGRAVDVSVKGWSLFHQNRLMHYLNKKYGEQLGTAPAGKKKRVIPPLNHGTAPHFHLQVRRGATLDGFLP